MRILKQHPILKPANDYVIDAPQPSNISYWWNVGSLLGLSLIIQIITGVTLAMHYNSSVIDAFNSVEHIMRDVNNGWLIRYLHSNTASAFFFLVYLHIGKGLYYGSYKAPRTLVWTIGTTIFILMIVTAFMGYVLPYGQMSLWGATVITNLMSAIPWIGQDIVEFIWGGFSVNNATLNRFFSLHFLFPFLLAALVLMHLMTLHDSAGSGNPVSTAGNIDRVPFAPYYVFKDLITVFMFMAGLSAFVFFMPNILGDSENYIMANPMQTPAAIVPEWYLLPFYAVLRAIPNKLWGVIGMLSAILIILTMVLTDITKLRGIQFKPTNKTVFFLYGLNLMFLMVLGAKHVESPFIEFAQIGTTIYFLYYILTVPVGAKFENSLSELVLQTKLKLMTTTEIISSHLSRSSAITHGFVSLPLQSSLSEDSESEKEPEGHAFVSLRSQKRGSRDVIINELCLKGGKCSMKDKIDVKKSGKRCRLCNPNPIPDGIDISGIYKSLTAILVFALLAYGLIKTIGVIYNTDLISCDYCDVPRPWGLYFQDSASPQMEALVELHDNIMFYLVIILFAVGWILLSIASKHSKGSVTGKYVSHGTLIELIWTVSPGLILVFIAFTSFKLLYLMDEVSDVNMTLYIEGHQWYWSYQYPDFMTDDGEFIEYDSYLIPESDLENGALRMLDVDERVIIPEVTHARFLVSSGDVIHSYACPSLGIKADAYPGRLNQASTLINRLGTFYGQCSEICGILHSSMPINIQSVTLEKFLVFLEEK